MSYDIVYSPNKYREIEGIKDSQILMQELNLCHRFGTAYWKAACLTVDSGISSTEKSKSIDYGKIAEAVCNMREEILPPCINSSKKGFSVKDNKILYGLVALNGVNEEEAETIIANRPYSSFNDFTERCKVSNKATISLIKSGAFNAIESDNRAIAMDYVRSTTNSLKSLSTTQADSIVENGLLPKELEKYVHLNKVRKEVLKASNLYEAINKTNGYYILSDSNLNILNLLGFKCDYDYNEEGAMIVEKTKFQNWFKKTTAELNSFLKSEDALNRYNAMLLNKEWNKKFSGDKLDWQMESVRTYFGTDHKLDQYDFSCLPIKKFKELSDGVKIDEYRYETFLLKGTVVNSDKDKHTLSLFTREGIVKVKMSKQHFAQYNFVNSEQVSNGKGKSTKVIHEDTWFKSGTHLVVQGFKQGEVFYAKGYKSSSYPIFTRLIGRNNEGNTIFKFGRNE